MGVFIEHLSIEDPTESSKMVLEVFPEFISNLDSLKKLTLKYGIFVSSCFLFSSKLTLSSFRRYCCPITEHR